MVGAVDVLPKPKPDPSVSEDTVAVGAVCCGVPNNDPELGAPNVVVGAGCCCC